jgi:vacuolar protein 8
MSESSDANDLKDRLIARMYTPSDALKMRELWRARELLAAGGMPDAPPDQKMDPMREVLFATRVFAHLVAMLGEGTAEDRAAAAKALWQLPRSAADTAAIVAAGAIVPLAALVRDGNARGKAEAAYVLANLSTGDAANTAAIVAVGAIGPLAALVRDGDAQGKATAAVALGNLSSGDAANTAAIAAAGAIVPLAALVRDGVAQGKANAACALGNLSCGTAANKAAIVAAGAIGPLLALVRDGDAQGKANAAVALRNLANVRRGWLHGTLGRWRWLARVLRSRRTKATA